MTTTDRGAGGTPAAGRLDRRKARTRAALVEAAQVLLAEGRTNVAVTTITEAADLGTGSFYNHFASKDALAIEALHQYQSRSVWRTTDDETDPPLRRLRRRFEAMQHTMAGFGYARGCFIGNMASELADLNPDIRAEVQASLDFRSATATALLREAQERGDLAAHLDPDGGLAGFWNAYNDLGDAARGQITGPLLNKLRAFLLRDFVRATLRPTPNGPAATPTTGTGTATDAGSGAAAAVLRGGVLLARLPQHRAPAPGL